MIMKIFRRRSSSKVMAQHNDLLALAKVHPSQQLTPPASKGLTYFGYPRARAEFGGRS